MDRIVNTEFFKARLQTAKSLEWLQFTAVNLSYGGGKNNKTENQSQCGAYADS